MRTTSALKTAALVITAVVLGLGTVQGSLAVWNTTTASAAGTVQAADFAVTLKSGSGAIQRLNANGQPATVALPALTGLKPGETRIIPVAVTNATAAGNGNFRIRTTSSTPTVTGAASGYLTATAGFGESDSCPAAAPPASAQLAQGGTATLCVAISLSSAAPATAGGQSNSVSVKLTATQL